MNTTVTLTPEQFNLTSTIVNGLNNGCRFVSFTYNPKDNNGSYRYTILLGIKYLNLIKSSLNKLQSLKTSCQLQSQAKQEIVDSLSQSLTGTNNKYTKQDVYIQLGNGVKINQNDNTIEIDGLVISKKTLIEPTNLKKVNSKPLTIEKNKIRKSLPIGKYRSFCLDKGCLDKVSIQGKIIVLS